MLRHARPLLALLLLTSACDMDEGPILDPDAGRDAGEPAGDLEAPEVVETTPARGASDVAQDAQIVIRFSEPMVEGTVAMHADGEAVTPERSWSADGAELSLSAALDSGVHVQVVVERDFTDVAGNALAAPYAFDFTTGDAVAPVVTGAEPGEGSEVSARMAELRISFSESMDPSTGALSLEGGPGTLGEIAWTLGGLVVPVSGLAYDTEYRVVLSDFADPAGNPLDGESYLGDGALDFTTGPDMDAPRVADASPSEGQIEVPDTETTVTVLFDEPMDTSVTEAALTTGGESHTVTGAWSDEGTRIDFDVSGLLARNAAHSLSLAGFRDLAGNALDPAPHLADGALDFVTGLDVFAPYVGFTDPVEGAADFSFRADEIVVVFSEAMDTSLASVEVSDGASSFTAEGTWSLAGTRLILDVSGALVSGRSYAIDFAAFRDLGGNPLDVGHAYLGDGALDFTLSAPTGESCRDLLTSAEATSTAGGNHVWVLPPGVVTVDDGSNTCDNNSGPDAVVRYTKTTASASDGGTVLRVLVTGVEHSMAVSVIDGQCDAAAVGLGDARLRCVTDTSPQNVYLDVGPGDYYVWVSRASSSSEFTGATVQISEVALPPEGESCLAPYTTSSAIHTAPATAGDPHVWTLPEGAVHAMDHAVAYNGPGTMVCDVTSGGDPDQSVGSDAVIRLPKTSSTSVGWLRLEATNSSYNLTAAALDRCDTADPAATTLACQDYLRGNSSAPGDMMEVAITGAAGDRYLWIAADGPYDGFAGARVEYKEIEPAAGDNCANAIPITVGTTNPITPDRPHRLPAPGCFELDENVTWYRFTASEHFTHVTATGEGNVALMRAADAAELGCQADAEQSPLIGFVPPGTDVCVAVASGSEVSALSVDAYAYSGNLGVVTPLGIGAPLDPTDGDPRPLGSDYWMAVTPTTLYMGVSSQGVLVAPSSGGAVAGFHDDVGSAELGNDAVAVGEALFVLDDSSTAAVRLRRFVTPAGMWSPTAWDTGSAYPSLGLDAITYDGTSLLYASDTSSSLPTHFFSISPTAPGPATLLGTNAVVENVVAIAADATYLYVAGSTDTEGDGVYRIPRSDVSATPVRLGSMDINYARAAIEIDDLATPSYLYVRDDDGLVHVIADPAGATPRHLGPIMTLEDSGDEAMTIDHATGALYLFESVTNDDGNFVRLD